MIERTHYEFDLHGHTKYSAFPEFINYSPEEAIIRAKEVGLDGIAITGHDTVKGLADALNIASREGIVLIPGIEITARVGLRTPHIVALGIHPEEVYRSKYRIPTLCDPNTVVAWIHDLGGLAIAAHPTEHGKQTFFSFEQVRELKGLIDGIETVTTFGKNKDLELTAREMSVAEIGASDFHMLSQIGLVGTKLFGKIETYTDALEAIKARECEAFIRTDISNELRGRRTPSIFLRQLRGEKL